MIEVLFFARLREQLGVDAIEVTLEAPLSTDELRHLLARRGDIWQQALAPEQPLMVAVNEELVSAGARVHDGDTVAFFPPVTGG